MNDNSPLSVIDAVRLRHPVVPEELSAINDRFGRIADRIDRAERRLPFVIEFLGSPKAGKTTVRDRIARLAEKNKLRVFAPIEGASLPSRRALRENLVAFNAWTGAYALQRLLETCIPYNQFHLLLLDRGIIDAACWFEVLRRNKSILNPPSRTAQDFFTLESWHSFLDGAFILTCRTDVSEERERKNQLARTGNLATAGPFLQSLLDVYEDKRWFGQLTWAHGKIRTVDTSDGDEMRVALTIAEGIADIIERDLNPLYITIPRELIRFLGYISAKKAPLHDWSARQELVQKDTAELDDTRKQLVSYAFVEVEGKILQFHRTGSSNRRELQKRMSIGVGGHVEACDLRENETLEETLVRALQRELSEELVFDAVPKIKLQGFINDESIDAGLFHVAAIHHVRLDKGRVRVREEVSDQEFGVGSWGLVPKERLFETSRQFDPWSQYIIEHLLGGPRAQLSRQALFRSSGGA